MQWLAAILIVPYIFLLLNIYRSLINIKAYNVTTDPVIFVTVVVACRNEEESLPLLLDCFAIQDYPKESFEVIVVDDNSADKTFKIASEFTGSENVIALKNTGRGKKQAIRTGINASSGNLIITTDADCRMKPSWIKTIASFHEKHKSDMIICPVQIESKPGFFGRFQELEFLSLQGITAGTAVKGNGVMCNGANLSFKKEVYLNSIVNLHDEIASGDDIFLLQSLKKDIMHKILWLESADAVVTTAPSPTILTYIKQRSRWISKSKDYNDGYSTLLEIVTIVTIFLLIFFLIAAFIKPVFIPLFLTLFLLKSVPDFLILKNTSVRYGKRKLLRWFLPAQFVYPLYVISIILFSLISPEKR